MTTHDHVPALPATQGAPAPVITGGQPGSSARIANIQAGQIRIMNASNIATWQQPPSNHPLVGGRWQGSPIIRADYDPKTMEHRLHLDDGRVITMSDQQVYQLVHNGGSGALTGRSNHGISYREWAELFPPMPTPRPETRESLLAKILRWYHASMTGDVRSPLLHLVGPPGCGKSTTVEQAAEILGVNLHIINVSRMNPLEVEGVQMPTDNNTKLLMLTATWWSQLKDGDIVLFDEFLRGFAEVYNSLLDVLTSRRTGAFHLPHVFFIAASNSMAAYDPALTDRLLHVPVDDPRHVPAEKRRIAQTMVDALGLHPDMAKAPGMEALLTQEVLPMYVLLDQLAGLANLTSSTIKGHSPRNLIGQVKLREVVTPALRVMIEENNRLAMKGQLYQHVILLDGKDPDPHYIARARKLQGDARLTEIQSQNLELNLQLVEMQEALSEIDEEIKEVDFNDPLS